MSGFGLRALCGRSRASAGRLRPIGLAALATCIILLSSFGSALAQAPTFTSIAGSPNGTVAVGQPITLTATVTPQPGPTGTVNFYYEPQNFLGTANLTLAGTAVLSNVPVGLHLVYAVYNGDSNFQGSTATPQGSISPGRLLSPKVLVPPQSL